MGRFPVCCSAALAAAVPLLTKLSPLTSYYRVRDHANQRVMLLQFGFVLKTELQLRRIKHSCVARSHNHNHFHHHNHDDGDENVEHDGNYDAGSSDL